MGIVDQKFLQRQKELERFAENLLVEQGVVGFSMDRLATLSGCSRPTVYQHFASKNDVIIAVVEKTINTAKAILGRPGIPQGNHARERAFSLFAAYEQFCRFHKGAFHIAEFLPLPWFQHSVPLEAAKSYEEVVEGYFKQVTGLLKESIVNGELSLPGSVTCEKVAFSSIVMVYGIYTSIQNDRVSLRLAGIDDPWMSAREAINAYWDGYGWKPLSTEHDYENSYDRLLRGVFPEYWLRAKTEALAKEVQLPMNDSR